MIRFGKYIMMCLALLLSVGCLEETFLGDEVAEGLPVEVTLGFDVLDSDVVTRAAQAKEYEFRVQNLYVFIFDNDGAVLYRHFFDKAGDATDMYGNAVNMNFANAANDEGTVSFKTVTAVDTKILAVANVTEAGVTETAYTITENMLDDVTSFAELQSTIMVAQQSIFRGGLFMMTGFARDNSTNSEEIDIVSSDSQLNCTIQLDRSDAKVEFRIETGTSAPGISDLTFIPSQWKVVRVPKESLVLPSAGNYSGGVLTADADVAGSATYFDTDWMPFEIKPSTGQTISGFTFYMPENRQVPRKLISGTDVNSVKLREERDQASLSAEQIANSTRPGHRVVNGDYTYANINSTYVEFTGTLSYTENEGGVNTFVNVLATFTVHLGQTGTPGNYTPNDYETKRNTHYIYNIKVNGANDVEVEVTQSDEAHEVELNPGYRGEVVKNSTRVYELDSHFERRVFSIHKNYIADDMTWGVSTLFSQGIHDPQLSKVEEDLRDYKWIKFAINYEHQNNASYDRFVDYPGNDHYFDPDGKVGLTYTSGGKTLVYPEGYATSQSDVTSKPLYDINQLIAKLKEVKNNPAYLSYDRIWVTAFIDEYMYYKHPVTYRNQAGDRTNQNNYISFWKNTINAQDRLMHFITSDAQYSPDGESSVVNTVYTFEQRSIKSLYRIDDDTIHTAWGIENEQEGNRFPITGSQNLYGQSGLSTDLNAGRANTKHWWRNNLSYNTVINNSTKDSNGEADPYALNANYRYIPYGCVNRNRDDNGNGVIDQEEVRWYLASVRNLSDFFIGQYCFDQSEFLYPGASAAISNNAEENNKINNGYFTANILWHYGNSSVKSSACDIFWAEEGCATGSYTYSRNTLGVDVYAYRCVRDLGVHYIQEEDEQPDPLYSESTSNETVVVAGKTYTVHTIDLSSYNPTSLRSNFETVSLPDHTEQGAIEVGGNTISESGNSRPYKKFQYIVSAPASSAGPGVTVNNGIYRINNGRWSSYHENDPCPDGWRMPNIRELSVMSMLDTDFSSLCSTRYSLQSYFTNSNHGPARPGFEFSGRNFSTQLGTSNNAGSVSQWDNHGTRCVRDYNN